MPDAKVQRWPFGTVVRSDNQTTFLGPVRHSIIAMVIADTPLAIHMISLGGTIPDSGGVDGFYDYGQVWTWTQGHGYWKVIDAP